MKKLLVILMLIALSICMVSCMNVSKDDDYYDNSGDTLPCTHEDKNDDGECDICFDPFEDGDEEPSACVHKDEDDDVKCDYCGEPYEDGIDKKPGGTVVFPDVDI